MGRPPRAGLEKGPSDNLSPGGFSKKPMHFAARSNRQNVAAAGAQRLQFAIKTVSLSLSLSLSLQEAFGIDGAAVDEPLAAGSSAGRLDRPQMDPEMPAEQTAER
jgi:hypothetical protein